jgi:uncharacterized damage-inducible protein DinB
MDARSILRRMAHNNAWANLRLHRAVGALETEDYRATTRTSFFPSIHLTLVHILFVDLYYVDALEVAGRGAAIWDDEAHFTRDGDLGALRALQRGVDLRLIAFVEALDREAALDVEVHLQRTDHVQVETRGDVLLHLFQHQIHHRGQVHAMLAGTAAAPPQLDEFFLHEELPLRESELRELGLPLV